MIKIFTGFDQREAVGWHVFVQSVLDTCSLPVEIIPITETMSRVVGGQRDGSNSFTYGRFLVPYLCGYEGWALFADGADMLCVADLAELWKKRNSWKAVQVVKHDYEPKYKRKYVGTEMECENHNYGRKNWSSLILWNCAHNGNKQLTPDRIGNMTGSYLHGFKWLDDDRIGELPKEWNWLDEYGEGNPKIMHYTNGIPGFEKYKDAIYANYWRAKFESCLDGMSSKAF